MVKSNNFPKEREIFVMPSGVIGKRKRIIYLEPKNNNSLEYARPLTEKERLNNLNLFEVYSLKVRSLSYSNLKLYGVLVDTENGFCTDHKISVRTCFDNNVSIEDAAHISNLRSISWKENIKKGKRNFFDDANLWLSYKYDIRLKTIKPENQKLIGQYSKKLINNE